MARLRLAERWVNAAIMALLIGVPLLAWAWDEPFVITLATKVAIFALAGVGLNFALGFGGLVSFGHAAFFGVGGYAAGILASHAANYEPLMSWPFEIEGSQQMLVIWIVAVITSALVALGIGALSLRTSGVYFIMVTLAFAQMLFYFAISWPAYGGEDGLSFYVRNSFPGANTFDPLQFPGVECAAGFQRIAQRDGRADGGRRPGVSVLASRGVGQGFGGTRARVVTSHRVGRTQRGQSGRTEPWRAAEAGNRDGPCPDSKSLPAG